MSIFQYACLGSVFFLSFFLRWSSVCSSSEVTKNFFSAATIFGLVLVSSVSHSVIVRCLSATHTSDDDDDEVDVGGGCCSTADFFIAALFGPKIRLQHFRRKTRSMSAFGQVHSLHSRDSHFGQATLSFGHRRKRRLLSAHCPGNGDL